MHRSAMESMSWPASIAFLGLVAFVMFLIGIAVAAWLEYRKTTIAAAQESAIRQLVSRYEQLATNALDAQQRVAADLAELRSRTASIEQILRTVE
jgi:flagellar basal body-associated protein FliL